MAKQITLDNNQLAAHVADFFKTGALMGFSSTQSISLAQHYRAEKDIYNYTKGE